MGACQSRGRRRVERMFFFSSHRSNALKKFRIRWILVGLVSAWPESRGDFYSRYRSGVAEGVAILSLGGILPMDHNERAHERRTRS